MKLKYVNVRKSRVSRESLADQVREVKCLFFDPFRKLKTRIPMSRSRTCFLLVSCPVTRNFLHPYRVQGRVPFLIIRLLDSSEVVHFNFLISFVLFYIKSMRLGLITTDLF